MALIDVKSASSARHRFMLVVDSDAKTLVQTSTLLERFQYKTWTAKNGAEALEIADIAMPALIVTCRQLEDMPGLELIRKLKLMGNFAVIVLTANKDALDERACLAAGAVTCLKTPISVESFYRVIQVAIEPVPRMHIRINSRLPVTITAPDMNGQSKCSRAISEDGLFIQTADPYALKTKVPLKIELPGRVLSAEAVVTYVHKTGNQARHEPGMGMRFLHISEKDLEHLRLFIRSELSRGLSIAHTT